ncbi:DEAD-box ATP-dependent RNA helicase 47, mitochondrial [Lycium ferocissimum]|uniref:DEAD-box ATP-dependent RNA helicase 47, mitochondrial n=1 Tax=Lycium ferocissimum TaxID=112874 RepID=UPI00281574EB|nr:DEAD-box ATP-dependent RNA helicase 47, mitochondrial [Lycium ferocissimum]
MPVLVLTRALLLVGDSLALRKVSQFTRIAPSQCNVRFLSGSGSLTLASLGLKSEVKTVSANEKNKLQQGVATIEVPKRREQKRVSGNKTGLIREKNPVDIKTAPFAAESFSELGLPPLLVERLEMEGFTVPTDVQAAAVPTVLENHDVVIQSYTGSGKTLAYLLPILSRVGPLREEILDGYQTGNKVDIEAVIVAPSRELGMQIVREVEKLLGPANRKLVQQLVGGANRSRQEEALRKNKPAIVVGTPGRIAEISAAGKLPTHGCRYLVLDEVDQLLAFSFREDMKRILDHVGRRAGAHGGESNSPLVKRAARQTIMVSATVPFSVIRAARSWGCDPLLIQANKVVPLESLTPSGPVHISGTPSTTSSDVQAMPSVQSLPPNLQHYYTITRIQHKIDMLRRCVHALDAKCVIAFMNHTKQLKDAVYKLEARGMNAAELHGDLSKLVRSTILKKFRNGEIRVLLTNELSARGLDLPECDLVVNLGLPTDAVHYAHRAGRTGRLGRKGTVVTICEEPEVFVVKKLQKQLSLSIQACEFSEGNLVIIED